MPELPQSFREGERIPSCPSLRPLWIRSERAQRVPTGTALHRKLGVLSRGNVSISEEQLERIRTFPHEGIEIRKAHKELSVRDNSSIGRSLVDLSLEAEHDIRTTTELPEHV